MNEQIKINWYRCKIDKAVMSELMKSSDAKAFAQVIPQIALYLTTGILTYLAFLQIHTTTWKWAVPLTLVAFYIHGTVGSFMGLAGPAHELSHKTPFKTKWLNDFFLKVYSFISWTDCIWFRPSHVKHHQTTVHSDYDGEVVLPARMNLDAVLFYLPILTCNPKGIVLGIWGWIRSARGNESDWKAKNAWTNQIVPETNPELRRQHRNWARVVVFGHLALAAIFIATGNWFLIFIFNFGAFYCGWLSFLCGVPQHVGLPPNTPDFRLCCRTYTCGWLPAFFYWNMQYHVEHHMFPAVPFYNLGKLRKAIEHDLPPAPHGLWATWKELVPIIRRQWKDPNYVYLAPLPQGQPEGERASDLVLEKEAEAEAPVPQPA